MYSENDPNETLERHMDEMRRDLDHLHSMIDELNHQANRRLLLQSRILDLVSSISWAAVAILFILIAQILWRWIF